jgi:hypothetical protein
MQFRVVSYYSRSTIYESIMVNYLMPCLDLFQIPKAIYSVDDSGSWEVNATYQPVMIWRAMKTHPTEAILWMDSDIIIRGYPKLFEEIPSRCDIGLYYRQHEDHWGGVPPGVKMPRPELNTGVIWFNNNPKMLGFVEKWMERCAEQPKTSHRIHLADLVNEYVADELSFFLIPRGYAYIAQREDGQFPAVILNDAVVVQFTASMYGKKNLYDLQ